MQSRIVRFLWPIGLLFLAMGLMGLTLLTSPAAFGRASGATAPPSEAWRLGVTSEGDASYTTVIGRLVGSNASFRSNRSVTDIYYIFPAPASARSVSSASLNILSRSGTYTGTASLTLEVRDQGGTLQRTVTAGPLDLQTAATGSWSSLALASDPSSLVVGPGEYLAFHFALSGAPAGDLDLRPVFEVVVQ